MYIVNLYLDTILKEFHLDDTGDVRRSKDGYQSRFTKGDLALFHEDTVGYLRIQVPKQRASVYKHHIIWVLHGNKIPEGYELDHKNGNIQDNYIDNLRLVDRQLNCKNRTMRSDNTSGITGINWSEYHGRYVIRRVINGKRISRSRKTLPEAVLVLEELKQLGDGYTDRHGK